MCGESCFKYSGQKKQHTCRHGFYYICNLSEWQLRFEGVSFRRRGKALRNALVIVGHAKHGTQGRILPLQEHPFEVQTNYAAASALRCNFDVQDLRRVLPVHLWKPEGLRLPSLPIDEARDKEMGYMGLYEWDAEEFVEREPGRTAGQPREPVMWCDELAREEWREQFLEALRSGGHIPEGPHLADCECVMCEPRQPHRHPKDVPQTSHFHFGFFLFSSPSFSLTVLSRS